LLGVAEAGYYPGILLYLTYWFRRREQAQMIALFMTAIPVSNILGAPLSGWILDHVHWLAFASLRWLLIFEGVPAVICGVMTYFVLPSRPAEAGFLTTEEKARISAELAAEQAQKIGESEMLPLRTLISGRVWHLACITFGSQMGSYAIFFWMP